MPSVKKSQKRVPRGNKRWLPYLHESPLVAPGQVLLTMVLMDNIPRGNQKKAGMILDLQLFGGWLKKQKIFSTSWCFFPWWWIPWDRILENHWKSPEKQTQVLAKLSLEVNHHLEFGGSFWIMISTLKADKTPWKLTMFVGNLNQKRLQDVSLLHMFRAPLHFTKVFFPVGGRGTPFGKHMLPCTHPKDQINSSSPKRVFEKDWPPTCFAEWRSFSPNFRVILSILTRKKPTVFPNKSTESTRICFFLGSIYWNKPKCLCHCGFFFEEKQPCGNKNGTLHIDSFVWSNMFCRYIKIYVLNTSHRSLRNKHIMHKKNIYTTNIQLPLWLPHHHHVFEKRPRFKIYGWLRR